MKADPSLGQREPPSPGDLLRDRRVSVERGEAVVTNQVLEVSRPRVERREDLPVQVARWEARVQVKQGRRR